VDPVTFGYVRYARRLLNDGEDVIVDVRPHWRYLSAPVAALVIVIVGAVASAIEGTPGWVSWLLLAALGLTALWLVSRYLRWVTTRLVVTTSRIIERRGIVARRGREIPLSALTDIGYRQTIFDRIIGAGDVVIESAGRESQESFPDLPNPARIHNVIFTQMQLLRSGPATWPGAAAGAPSIPSQIDHLDQLRRRGVITDQEFEAKKVELLNRL
jgi:membrane protein YdbS with pleckstrin-like domain